MNFRPFAKALLLGACSAGAASDLDVYLLVNKQANELTVYSLQEPTKILQKYRAISGSSLGDKVKEGDRKTPEGVYFLEREIPKSRLTALHGAAAFELNYPNPFDRIHDRTGYGIWIHGVDRANRMEKRFDTQGCVALANADVVELRKWVGDQRMTPVIIVDELVPGQPVGVESNDGPLIKRVRDWVTAWSSKDPEAYLAFYDTAFRARGMNYGGWAKYKRRLARQYERIQVNIEDLRVFRHGKYSVALFKQKYLSNRYESNGWKRLYLLGEGPEARILSEEMRNEISSFPPPPAPAATVAAPESPARATAAAGESSESAFTTAPAAPSGISAESAGN